VNDLLGLVPFEVWPPNSPYHQELIYQKKTHEPNWLCVLCLAPERFLPSDYWGCPFGIPWPSVE